MLKNIICNNQLVQPVQYKKCFSFLKVCHRSFSSSYQFHDVAENQYKFKNILLLKKITRYEYEKQLYEAADRLVSNETDFRFVLDLKGSDYDGLLERHIDYQSSLQDIIQTMVNLGLSVNVVDRHNYKQNLLNCVDAVFTAGGDGTFLLAATNVKGRSIPVVGINTDPERSEGFLCLPPKYTDTGSLKSTLSRFLNGNFRWLWRHRIRITMSGRVETVDPMSLHDQELMYPELRYHEHVYEDEQYARLSHTKHLDDPETVLPTLALNEVFVGESLSARVSFYEYSIDGAQMSKEKSSGVTICTGTGSSSWYFNINYVPPQSAEMIFQIAQKIGGSLYEPDRANIETIVKKFNASLRFNPSFKKMAYVVRDPIPFGLYQVKNPRGFCTSMVIKSRMWDACVVVDGGYSYAFNDGSIVRLDILDEDALRCVQFD